MDGFTYNGFDSKLIRVYVNPNAQDRWFESPAFEQKGEEGSWKNGGYFYGTRVKTRTISISCWFEDITMRQREKLRLWLGRDTEGWLIMDERPFVKYKVRPSGITNGQMYASQYNDRTEMLYSGTFTANFTAYDPLGYLIYSSYSTSEEALAAKYCNMLPTEMMPPLPNVILDNFLIYNPGTEVAPISITVGGIAPTGLTITNTTNGTECEQKELPESYTLTIDSSNGLIIQNSINQDYGFEYHHHGFITIDPNRVLIDDVVVYTTAGSNTCSISGLMCGDESLYGKYIYIDNGWKKIVSENGSGSSSRTLSLNSAASQTNAFTTKIVEMNEISVEGSGITLHTLSYTFTPRIL